MAEKKLPPIIHVRWSHDLPLLCASTRLDALVVTDPVDRESEIGIYELVGVKKVKIAMHVDGEVSDGK